jgi:hypothetical protein
VPEGLLAARIVPGASITEVFERSSDCVEGAVGLWPQAASNGIMARRGDNFIQAPVWNVLTNDLRGLPHWLSTRGQPRCTSEALGGADFPTFAACTHTFTAE